MISLCRVKTEQLDVVAQISSFIFQEANICFKQKCMMTHACTHMHTHMHTDSLCSELTIKIL